MESSTSAGSDHNVEELFKKAGVVREGHFVLTSGLHSPVYWEKFKILQYPEYTGILCSLIAKHFRDKKPTVVVGPTTGGVILAFETARLLGTRGLFAEKDGATRVLRRDFTIQHGEKVLVVDDVLTTGKSVRETLDAVRSLGGDVIGVGVLVDRSTTELSFRAELFSCLRSPAVTYAADECPLCSAGIPIHKPGSS
ncbi:MAG: orotate phosphoribosyltransferase [Dehalococcoidia bacterium]|nr:orotate phosphoribosyltransferase [Dehalococcoidia bacterium]